MVSDEVELRILESYTKDVGLGIARIGADSMRVLGVAEGDTIAIHGRKRTVAKCMPLLPSDQGRGIVRIDGLIRRNAAAEFGGTVRIRKSKAVPAGEVILNPLEDIPDIDEKFITDVLAGHPFTKDDLLVLPAWGGRMEFQVVQTRPEAEVLLVTDGTRFTLPKDRIVSWDLYQEQRVEEFAENGLTDKPAQIVKDFSDEILDVNKVLRAMNSRGYFATSISIVREKEDARGMPRRDYVALFTKKDRTTPP